MITKKVIVFFDVGAISKNLKQAAIKKTKKKKKNKERKSQQILSWPLALSNNFWEQAANLYHSAHEDRNYC